MGPNAIGKTIYGKLGDESIIPLNFDEFAMNLMDKSVIDNIKKNPLDQNAQHLFYINLDNVNFEASVKYHNEAISLVKQRKNISLEGNTLPGNYSDSKSIIKYPKSNGYEINLIFLACDDIDFLIHRVYQRTLDTGQFIGVDGIVANFKNGLNDINEVIKQKNSDWDTITIFDIDKRYLEKMNFLFYKDNEKVLVPASKDLIMKYEKLLPNLVYINNE